MTSATMVRERRPRRFRRTLLSMRWWHNWVGVFIGVVLVLWVISGLIMLLPVSDTARSGVGTSKPIQWLDVAISPAAAATAAVKASGSSVRGLELKRIRDDIAYLVRIEPRGGVLVDARTGSIITITDTLAAAIAADGVRGGTASIGRIDRVDTPGNFSGHGPLPAWHVIFTDDARTEAWVHIASGDVRRSTLSDRRKSAWGHGAHVFSGLNSAPGGNTSRLGALWITSIISMFAMIAGYWLALPARWRAKVRT